MKEIAKHGTHREVEHIIS